MKAVAALALLALGGCGSIANLAEGPRIYGGLRKDVEWFDSPCTAGLGFLDFPLSAALDTALLPVTVVCEACRK